MDIETKSKNILMQIYEWQNEVNCYGFCPQKSDSKEYQTAKETALRATFNTDLQAYIYILENL